MVKEYRPENQYVGGNLLENTQYLGVWYSPLGMFHSVLNIGAWGFLDMISSLQWVQQNVAALGGELGVGGAERKVQNEKTSAKTNTRNLSYAQITDRKVQIILAQRCHTLPADSLNPAQNAKSAKAFKA